MEVPAITGTPVAVEEDSPVVAQVASATPLEAEEVRPEDLRHQALQATPATLMATGAARIRRIAVGSRPFGRGTGRAPTR